MSQKRLFLLNEKTRKCVCVCVCVCVYAFGSTWLFKEEGFFSLVCMPSRTWYLFSWSRISDIPEFQLLRNGKTVEKKHNRVLRRWLPRHPWSLPLIPLEELNSWLPWLQGHGLGNVYLTGWPDIWLQPYEERNHVWILTHSLQSVSHVYFYSIFIEI